MAPPKVSRVVYVDTGPDNCSSFSGSFALFFFCRATTETNLIPWKRDVPEWDPLRCVSPDIWEEMKALGFKKKEEWEERLLEVQYVPHLLKWALYMDPVPGNRAPTDDECARSIADASAAFINVRRRNDMDNIDLTHEISNALLENEVVLVSAPPGYGKSVLARSIVLKLLEKEKTAGKGPNGAMARGEVDRQPCHMTKSLHCVPTVTNAAAIARFVSRQAMRDDSVAGMVNPLQSMEGQEDPDLFYVEHVVIPYRWAERIVEEGRYKLIVIDEVHVEDVAITSVLWKSLCALAAQPSTTAAHPVSPYKRVDKLLLFSGVRSPALERQIESVVEANGLTLKKLRLPDTDAAWEQRRFPVTRSHLHACPGSFGAAPPRSTPLSLDIAYRGSLEGVIGSYVDIYHEDLCLATEPLDKCPDFVIKRIVLCTRSLIAHFVKEADAACSEWKRLRAAKELHKFTEYKFPTILVFCPSTGVARQVYKSVRFCVENKMYPFARSLSCDYLLAYQFEVNATIDEEERALSEALNSFCYYIEKDGTESEDHRFVKGQVLIVVNGVETGLTIDSVGGVVDSGLERIRGPYNRSGISTSKFTLTDLETMEQRAGRAGRTRAGEYVLALGPDGLDAVTRRKDKIIQEKRSMCMRQMEFLRLCDEPGVRAHTSLLPLNWNEGVTEARVKGTVIEGGRNGQQQFQPALWTEAHLNLKRFPNVDPTHVRMLRALAGAGLTLQGLVRVAMLTTGEHALSKPSSNSQSSDFGISDECNSLDWFTKGVTNYFHEADEEDGRVKARALKDYDSDTVAIVDLHVQLITASGWMVTDAVPSKEQLLARGSPHRSNFWAGEWIRKEWIEEDKRWRDRLQKRKEGERNNFTFLYGRMIEDEERRRLWGCIKSIAMCMKMAGMIRDFDEIYNGNVGVVGEGTDPLITFRGRALFGMIELMHSSRFAQTEPSYSKYKRGVGKARGWIREWYNCNEKMYSPKVRERVGEVAEVKVLARTVRAESSWKIRTDHTWLRYDPTETMTRVGDGELFISLCDPFTDTQMMLFANISGRWRVVGEKTEETGSTGEESGSTPEGSTTEGSTTGENGSISERYVLEIECNGCPALYGINLELTEEQAVLLRDARQWLTHYIPLYVYGRGRQDMEYTDKMEKLIDLWLRAGSKETKFKTLPKDMMFFEDY